MYKTKQARSKASLRAYFMWSAQISVQPKKHPSLTVGFASDALCGSVAGLNPQRPRYDAGAQGRGEDHPGRSRKRTCD
jgi:hypothetical protein